MTKDAYPEPKSPQSSAKCVGWLGHATNQYLRMSERSELCVASNLAALGKSNTIHMPYGDPNVQRSSEPRCRHRSQNLLPHLPARLTLLAALYHMDLYGLMMSNITCIAKIGPPKKNDVAFFDTEIARQNLKTSRTSACSCKGCWPKKVNPIRVRSSVLFTAKSCQASYTQNLATWLPSQVHSLDFNVS